MELINENKPKGPWNLEIDQYNALLHLSQFAGLVVPFLGTVLPIAMWIMHKNEDASINEHGKRVVNWVISSWIYIFIFGILSFLLIGLPFLIIVTILCFIFPIIGAVKAVNGELYNYPLAIEFVR